jgi:polar amino acid transport system substrate-binding protein
LVIGVLLVFIPVFIEATPEKGTILLGVTSDGWPPYIFVNDGDISGIAIDVLRTISEKGGYVLQIGVYPARRADRLVREGLLDAILDAKEWAPEPELFLWTDPIIDSEDLLISSKDNPIVFEKIDDLFGKTIGTRFNYMYPTLERYFKVGSIQRVDARSDTAMLKMVYSGRTDAAVINKWVALWVLKQEDQLKYADFVFSKQLIDRAGYCVMFTSHYDWLPFIGFFNAELHAMKQDGRFSNIISKYR